jgi:hypothetical protein
LNDLWKYSAGQWTWVGGSNTANQPGIYGSQGTASSSNVPGARQYTTGWVDHSGAMWLIGGTGVDSTGALGFLNDFWKFSAGQWTWVSGSNTANQTGQYGMQGVAAVGNFPGARSASVSWSDGAGNFWLFGGNGFDSTGTQVSLNDLWKYSGGQWTWVGGSNIANQQGSYGTVGVAAPGNIPAARSGAVSWMDTSGNFWLFGGAFTNGANFNDLWEYQP